MTTEVQLYKIGEMQIMAEAVAKSGLFGMKTPDQALALMLVAQSENCHPATITQDYDIIQGKACRKTHSVLARFQQMGGRVEWHELTDKKADATFSHSAGGSLRMAWTFEQAQKAGLTNKDNWKNYPRAMLRARCIAEGIRAVYPAAIGGMMIAEEAQDSNESQSASRTERVVTGEVIRDNYPAEDFAKNLPKWKELIESGRKTGAQIAAMVQSKAPLTAEQEDTLLALRVTPINTTGEMSEAEIQAIRARELAEAN